MLNNLRKTKSEGFTIIEVMIVLAIAALILLIVLLAVPALQRNSRNTQRKNDISALSAAVNEYTSNNAGALPTTAAQVTALAKTGYYNGVGAGQGQINLVAESTNPGALPATSAGDRVVIVTGATCGANGAPAAGSSRQVAVLYDTETSNGFTATCQQE